MDTLSVSIEESLEGGGHDDRGGGRRLALNCIVESLEGRAHGNRGGGKRLALRKAWRAEAMATKGEGREGNGAGPSRSTAKIMRELFTVKAGLSAEDVDKVVPLL